MSPITEMRNDIGRIITIKKIMEYNCLYNKDNGMFFKGTKEDCLREGCDIIKSIIVDLANKYKKDKSWKYRGEEER